MNISGLKVDVEPIAEGLYGIICDRGEESLVAFGMLPKWIMDMTERLVREKILNIWAGQLGCTVKEAMPFCNEVKLKEKVQAVMDQVATGIYGAAKSKGMMVV